ncbi:MAG TPA: tetraacyldisaccharide 4'-kinase [Chryseolinea sp.]|nr:tetraacyldisaccharide 4'-kinase [Chryseolinea sp.]
MTILRVLLFPFAILFNLVTGLRNRLYDQGSKSSIKFDLPVIAVGNLTAGGTGKTPLIEYLIRLLARNYHLATLSRGYGRSTKGFRMAQPTDSASTLGDEPFQFFLKFGDRVKVAVGEERALAIPNILHQHPNTEVILLDDAFQHRRVIPSLNILLTDYRRPFYEDFLLPAGRLRESRAGAGRADIVIVTKCPAEITDEEMIEMEKSIREFVERPVFFTQIRYGNPTPLGRTELKMGDQIVLLSGISNSQPLEHYVSQNYKLKKHFNYADHHSYTNADIERLSRFMKEHPSASILTTEKDKVKLAATEFESKIQGMSIFYLPIEVEFIKNGQDFDEMVLNSIRRAG